MTRETTAIAHGAATIVNAMALGKGAAFGVDLFTKAQVELTDEVAIFNAEIVSDPKESTVLMEKTVARVLQYFKVERQFGAKVKTWSNIPIAKGLKSSSAAANAVALATTAALGQKLDDIEIVRLGVDAAFDAKVTVTGAFDDACASYFGGVVITDNLERKLLRKSPLPKDMVVLFHVPPEKSYTADSNVERVRKVKPLVQVAYKEALAGKFWESLTLNGIIYSSAWGYDSSIAIDALEAGAVAAGLCGKGPAVTAVTPLDKVDSVSAAFKKFDGEVLQANFNQEKAKVI
ncbi:MAG TPA: shikimate kinase [Candidatus Acidoferrales bacterium]|nr:shikimate kinase [Candidatus Acidoferrales bacterium]